MKSTLSWILAVVVIIAGVWFFQTKDTDDITETPSPTPSQKISPETAADPSQMIEVIVPIQNATITSPYTITGRARGPWYFEASFPIELRMSNGTVIATTIGQAQGEWMTEAFVPFSATLSFPNQPAGSTGELVFKNDNPSGLPENEMSLKVPVQF